MEMKRTKNSRRPRSMPALMVHSASGGVEIEVSPMDSPTVPRAELNSKIESLRLLGLVGLVMTACAGGWALEGSARVLGWHDVERAGIRSCVVFLEVRNDGPVRITRSTISFRVNAASRSYYRTLVLDTHLPSGGILYAESFVGYVNPQESVRADGGVALIGCSSSENARRYLLRLALAPSGGAFRRYILPTGMMPSGTSVPRFMTPWTASSKKAPTMTVPRPKAWAWR